MASFPGSGNTWTRYLLQQSTGVWTGSVYNDKILAKNGFIAEHVTNSSVIFIKTHKYQNYKMKGFDRIVLVVRDPAEAILSEFHRRSSGHTGHASIDLFTGINEKSLYMKFQEHWKISNLFLVWHKFVKGQLNRWKTSNLSWTFKSQKPILIVYYDELKKKMKETLRKILKFVNFPVDESLLNCTMSMSEGVYKRIHNATFNPFTPKLMKMIKETQDLVYKELAKK